MLIECFKVLNAFFCKCGSELTTLKVLSVDYINDFLGYATSFEDNEGIAL